MADSLIKHVALVSETSRVKSSDLSKASAALQKQVTRDFGPLWSINATVDAFDTMGDVPSDYWPVLIRDTIPFDAMGIHLDRDGQPYALVRYSDQWAMTLSHEVLEMLADPIGNRVVAGPSVMKGQGRVRYLVEICDPSEDDAFSYPVNEIRVSDFYTPHFFDPTPSPGVKYSFTGAITRPREVLKGGYISFQDVASGEWWQQRKFGADEFVSLGMLDNSSSSKRLPGETLREAVDRLTPSREQRRQAAATASVTLAAAPAPSGTRASRFEADIALVLQRIESIPTV